MKQSQDTGGGDGDGVDYGPGVLLGEIDPNAASDERARVMCDQHPKRKRSPGKCAACDHERGRLGVTTR